MRRTGNRTGSSEPMKYASLLFALVLLTLQGGCASAQGGRESAAADPPIQNAAPQTKPEQGIQPVQTPEERYWQLRFALALTDGVDEEILNALEAQFGPPDGTLPEIPDLASYEGAGYRIASSNSILKALADLSAFRQVAGDDMQAELSALEREYPHLPDALNEEILAEEVLIVRSAILDSLETLAQEDPAFDAGNLAAYREGTLRARNELEYLVFAQDMDALADRSIIDTTGRLDAFHRMLDDNEDAVFLRERILAAEEMNRQLTDEHRQYAARRAVRALFFLLPAISNYFRYR